MFTYIYGKSNSKVTEKNENLKHQEKSLRTVP